MNTNNIFKNNQTSGVCDTAAQTGYFLSLALLLLIFIAIMLGTNIGYDYLTDYLQNYAENAQASVQESKALTFVLSTKAVSQQVVETIDYLKQLEASASEALLFKPAHYVLTILAFIGSLIAIGATFKKGISKYKSKNWFLAGLSQFFIGFIILLVFLQTIATSIILTETVAKIAIPLLINFVLIVILYYLTIRPVQKLSKILLSAFSASISISLNFYLLLYLANLIAQTTIIYAIMLYILLFSLELMIIPYIIVLITKFTNKDNKAEQAQATE